MRKTDRKIGEATTYVPRQKKFSDITDNELLALYLEGKEGAFTELYNRYRPRLHHFIYRFLEDSGQAEDIIQETFLRVFRSGRNFDQTQKFSTWVYKIAGNLAKNELRYQSKRPARNFTSLAPRLTRDDRAPENRFVDKTANPMQDFYLRDAMEKVGQALRILPEPQRTAFVLRHSEGRTYDEIASITRTNLGTVKSRLFRAREALGLYLSHLNSLDA